MVAYAQNTIVAISTPPGIGGIAVIRISGPESLSIVQKLTKQPSGKYKNRYALFTPLYSSSGKEIDNGIVTYFKSPNSFTGEDVVEISCHGGNIISNILLESCIYLGCDPAEHGEFTKRAFLNGKLDLSQAEAVADIISSKSRLGEEISYRNLSGKLSNTLSILKQDLLNIISLIESELDFTDDEITPTSSEKVIFELNKIRSVCQRLINSYTTGRILTEGAIVTIAGKTNVGKSSLLNAIISEERVLVSHQSGTTRDTVEVYYQIKGLPIRIFDTAGLRETEDAIEIAGINKTKDYISRSDLILYVFDAKDGIVEIRRQLEQISIKTDANYILIINKIDILSDKQRKELLTKFTEFTCVSAKICENIDFLLDNIFSHLSISEETASNEVFITNARHKNSLENCLESITSAMKIENSNLERELVAQELRGAMFHVDRILGITTADDILNNIFSSFCIGK